MARQKNRNKKTSLTLSGDAIEPEEDIRAITDVIRADTLAFQERDFEAWADCWVQDDRSHDVSISDTAGFSVYSGWAEIESCMKRVFNEGLGIESVDFEQKNIRINVDGNLAWVVFDGWSKHRSGASSTTFETRILERRRGDWKIIYSSFVYRQNGGPLGLVIGADAEGRILYSTHESLEALKNHALLTISAGRVRARRLDWEKALKRALRRASQYHGFYETHKFAVDTGGPAQFPVILGPTPDGGVAIVHLSIRDGITYLRLDAEDVVGRRLQQAQEVFDISDRQMKVARGIALGSCLKEIAEDLGVSVNTVRTHLSRLFEKTGVRTQAALVRLLLSVG